MGTLLRVFIVRVGVVVLSPRRPARWIGGGVVAAVASLLTWNPPQWWDRVQIVAELKPAGEPAIGSPGVPVIARRGVTWDDLDGVTWDDLQAETERLTPILQPPAAGARAK